MSCRSTIFNCLGQNLLGCACRLSYDEGADEESFEWVDFRELTDQEVRQHPSYPVVQPRLPPAPKLQPTPAPDPKPAAEAASSDPEQVKLTIAACQDVQRTCIAAFSLLVLCTLITFLM